VQVGQKCNIEDMRRSKNTPPPGENSYLQRTLVMLRGKAQDSLNINKHLNLWNGFVSVLI